MNDRYSHQVTFWGPEKQALLSRKTVVVVGVGSLGSVVAELLTRAGIGKLVLIDHDIVESHNLQRQSLYTEADVNKLKAEVAEEKLHQINHEVSIKSYAIHLDETNTELLQGDIVFDCTDNAETRAVINHYCHTKIPWIYCSIAGSTGMVLPFTDSFCFHCLFGQSGLSCQTEGILNTTVTATASLQVSEGLKILLGEESEKNLLVLDVWKNTLEYIKVKQNPNCLFCQRKKEIEQKKPFTFVIQKCASQNRFIIKPNQRIELDLEQIKERYEVLTETPILLVISVDGMETIVNQHGEIIVKNGVGEEQARAITESVYNYKK